MENKQLKIIEGYLSLRMAKLKKVLDTSKNQQKLDESQSNQIQGAISEIEKTLANIKSGQLEVDS